MPRTSLRERIKQGLFLLDGAMGTELIARGIEAGKCSDYLNVESPDIILDIHRSYLKAGSDAILTNTFGANRFALARHGLRDKVEKINLAGAQIARRKDAFVEQAKALLDGGVDGFIIETMAGLDEATIAIEAVKSISDDLLVLASFAFNSAGGDYRTMMGIDVEAAVSKAVSLAVNAVGFNCGTATLDEYVGLAGKYVATIKALEKARGTGHERRVTIFAEPNAGKPELVDSKAVYKVSPEDFAAAAEKIHAAGVNIIGGCCGTGPAHIEAAAKRLKN